MLVNAVAASATLEHVTRSGGGLAFETYAVFEAALDRLLLDDALQQSLAVGRRPVRGAVPVAGRHRPLPAVRRAPRLYAARRCCVPRTTRASDDELERTLAEQWERVQHRGSYSAALSAPLDAVASTGHFHIPDVPASSKVPGGGAVHSLVGKTVTRHLTDLCAQLDEFAALGASRARGGRRRARRPRPARGAGSARRRRRSAGVVAARAERAPRCRMSEPLVWIGSFAGDGGAERVRRRVRPRVHLRRPHCRAGDGGTGARSSPSRGSGALPGRAQAAQRQVPRRSVACGAPRVARPRAGVAVGLTMRVLYVVPRYGPLAAGGAEGACRSFATRMAARGHSVEVVTSCATSYLDWANVLPSGHGDRGRRPRCIVCRPSSLATSSASPRSRCGPSRGATSRRPTCSTRGSLSRGLGSAGFASCCVSTPERSTSQWCSRTCTSPLSRRSRRSPVARRSCSTRAPTTSPRCGFRSTSGSFGSATRSASSPKRRPSSCGAGSDLNPVGRHRHRIDPEIGASEGPLPPVAYRVSANGRTSCASVASTRARERSSWSSGSVATRLPHPGPLALVLVGDPANEVAAHSRCVSHRRRRRTDPQGDRRRQPRARASVALRELLPRAHGGVGRRQSGRRAGAEPRARGTRSTERWCPAVPQRGGARRSHRSARVPTRACVSASAKRAATYVGVSLPMGRRARAARIAAGSGSILKTVPPTPEVVNAPRPDHWHHRPRRPASWPSCSTRRATKSSASSRVRTTRRPRW